MSHSRKTQSVLALLAILATAVSGAMPVAFAFAGDLGCSAVEVDSCCGTDSCCCCSPTTSEPCGCESDPVPPAPVNETPISPAFGDQVVVLPSLSELAMPIPAKCRTTGHMSGVRPVLSGGLCVRNCVWRT